MQVLLRLAIGIMLSMAPLQAQSDRLAAASKRGKELMEAKNFEEAIPVYRDLARALPNNPGPHMNLGLALHLAGHDQEAVSELRLASSFGPFRRFNLAHLGTLWVR